MHDLAFADAAAEVRLPIILRLQMLPYSIGHELILLNQRNALLFDNFNALDFEQHRKAIIRAALVCYRTWKQNAQRERNLWLWGKLIRKSNWAAEIAEFRIYRNAGSAGPPGPTQEAYEIAAMIQGEEPGREFGGSNLARLMAYSCRVFSGLGYETPYDVPLGFLNHVYLSELEVIGNARIENAKEAQVREEMAQHRADVAREKAGEQCQL
jgi:hypothetical protein